MDDAGLGAGRTAADPGGGPGFLWGLLARRVVLTPDRPAVRDTAGPALTWAELERRARAVAADLRGRGVTAGTVVTWQLPTRVDAVVLLLALSRLGATQNPLLPTYGERELAFILRQARPALLVIDAGDPARAATARSAAAAAHAAEGRGPVIVTSAELGRIDPDLAGDPVVTGPVDQDPVDQDPGGPARTGPPGAAGRWYFYTSGTTSNPKGVVQTDRAVLAAGRTLVERLGLRDDDRYGAVFPICHIGGPAWQAAAMIVGFETMCVERFAEAGTIPALREFGVTIGGAGPPFFLAYLRAQTALPAGERLFPRVRVFPGGGSGCPANLYRRMADTFGTGILPAYGLTEAPIVAMGRLTDSHDRRVATEGPISPGAEIRIVAADGRGLPPGTDGEIQIRGEQLMVGYLDPELTAAAITADGWLRTGDLGRLDAAGYLSVTGRIKDVIIRNMENVSAPQVEEVLSGHPAIEDVAVVGLPDERTGERVCAVVVPADPGRAPDLREIADWCAKAGLTRGCWPEQLEIVASLPRGPVGKVAKAELRASLRRDQAGTSVV